MGTPIIITLLLGGLLAVAILHTLLPATKPLLQELCEGEDRGTFWAKFIGLVLVFASAAGMLTGLSFGDRLYFLTWSTPERTEEMEAAFTLRLALQSTAAILLIVSGWVYLMQRARDSE